MKRTLTRRSLLRGSAALIALPWLEIMRPFPGAGPAANAIQRIAFVYVPNGVITGHWFATPEMDDFLVPQTLRPLQSIRDDIVLINGLSRKYFSGEPHSQCGSCWLTSARPDENTGGGFAIDTTLDQIIAARAGTETPFPSLELSCNSFTDNMEPKYFDAISWYGPGHDARSMNRPAAVFQRLFGGSQGMDGSVLDTVLEDAADLHRNLGAGDRRKLDEYMESVRSIERRMELQGLSRERVRGVEDPVGDSPPVNRGDYIRLMGDLMILAFRTDQTRIASLMVGPERWETPQMYDSIFEKPVNHHQMTHDNAYDEDVARIDRFHVEQMVYVVNRLRETTDADGRLLDSTLLVFGSGLSDGNSHSYKDLPLVLAGGSHLGIRTGRQVQCSPGTPLANLWLTVGRKMGVEMEHFADSSGEVSL